MEKENRKGPARARSRYRERRDGAPGDAELHAANIPLRALFSNALRAGELANEGSVSLRCHFRVATATRFAAAMRRNDIGPFAY